MANLPLAASTFIVQITAPGYPNPFDDMCAIPTPETLPASYGILVAAMTIAITAQFANKENLIYSDYGSTLSDNTSKIELSTRELVIYELI